MPTTASPVPPRRAPGGHGGGRGGGGARRGRTKHALVHDRDDPSQWLGFSLPSRQATPAAGAPLGVPRRSRRGDAWRGSALTREKFVNASFRFVLKPTEALSYGAHFADPDIALHWPNILQVLVPTFSSFSVAQGFVGQNGGGEDEDAFEGEDGEEAAERRRRIEEERQGRTCPICLTKPVAGRMTKCGHIFCFPCILHFIQLSDIPKAAACPICGDTIHEGMLKSVRYLDAETMVKSAAVDDSGAAHSSELVNAITEAQGIDASSSSSEAQGIDASTSSSEAQGIDASSSSSTPRAVHLLHMRLMQRPQMSTMSLPISATWPSDATPPLTAPWLFIPDVLAYSRFMMATPEYMLSELQRELGELQGEWDLLAGDELGRSFVTAAREKVDRQVGKVCNELMTPMVRRTEADSRAAWAECVGRRKREEQRRLEREARNKERELQKEKEATEGKDDGTEVPVEFLAASGHQYTGPTVHVPPNLVVEPNPMPPKRNRRRPAPAPATPPSPPSTAYYFYQSSLGANVFLNPLDSRMLLAQFESYAACPPRITFPTTGYDTATVTDDLRRRVKYLSHLPVGTEVVFVEADLSRIVSRDVLAQFEQPLRARRDKRRKRARREDRDKRRAEEAERARRPDDSNTYVVPSALAFADDDDTELARALAASRLGTDTTFPLPSEAGPGMFGTSPTSPTSPSAMLAHSPTAGGSFAWAVHSRAVSSRRGERVAEGVNEAWSGVLDDHEEEPEDTTAGRKKKGGKKGKKLVLGGGGGRRA